jgi:hypothetical protein
VAQKTLRLRSADVNTGSYIIPSFTAAVKGVSGKNSREPAKFLKIPSAPCFFAAGHLR